MYKAHDAHLDRSVSIKVLPPGRVADPERKRRFVQEAKAASALNHPNILHIYDIDTADGVDFIAMEFVDGKTLDELIGRKGLKLRQALKYAVQIADALAAAHATGIIHRDIKPSNIMVNHKGLVKILDFGLAKLSEQVEANLSAPTQTMRPRTEEGAIVGTVAYMSPEQAEGRKVDARSDIFSFGSVLYEMVTGRRAFQGDTKISTLSAILHEEPPPISQISENTHSELERIIVRCLRKDPARRIQHIVDVRLALEELKEESESGPQAPTSVARAHAWRRWALAALLAVVPVAGFFAWQAWRAPQPEGPLRAVALTTFPGIESYPSLSPDGNHVAFMWTGPKQDNPDIYVQMIGAGSPLRLTTDPRSEYNPVWSPDGRWIAFLRAERLPPPSGPAGKSELCLIPPLGGPERKLAEIQVRIVGRPGFLAWCPDSTCLVVTDSPGEDRPDALFVVSRETAEKSQLTSPPAPLLGDSNPAVSPDGRWLVFRRVPAASAGELYTLPLGTGLTGGGEPTPLTPAALDAAYPAWMPDGKEILFSAKGSLWRLAVPAESPPARLPFVGENGLMPAITRPPHGRPARLVYVRSFSDSNIWRVDTSAPGAPALSSPVAAISSTRWDNVGDFSPDGRRVAFASDRSGEPEIWLAVPDGSNAVQLTSMGGPMTAAPRWSPDGGLIVFQSNREGQFEIYAISAAGGKPRRITSHPGNDHAPIFSRDGQWIYFSSTRSGDYQIWKVLASGGEAVQVTHSGGFLAFEGTDSADLYYTQAPGTPSALWRIPTSGGRPARVLEGVISSTFAVLKRGIYYIDRPSDQARLQFFDFATGRSRTVSRSLGDVGPLLTASPDGRTILYTRLDSSVDDLMLVENFR